MVDVRKRTKPRRTRFLKWGFLLVAVVALFSAGSVILFLFQDGVYYHSSSSSIHNSYGFLFADNTRYNNNNKNNNNNNIHPLSGTAFSCQRPCPARRNKIVIDHFGLNGLADRESIFHVMSSLAGYLCATLYVPPPRTMLSVSHNGNKAIPLTLMWRDFYSFVFPPHNATALRQYQASLTAGKDIPWDRTPFNLSQVVSAVRQEVSSDSWLRISTQQPEDFVSHFEQLETFVNRQQQQQQHGRISSSSSASSAAIAKTGFLWEVYTPHFYWLQNLTTWFSQKKDSHERRSLPRLLSDESQEPEFCDYIWNLPSPVSLEIVDLVFDAIRERHPNTDSLGLFHIRRGDSMDACDTSLPRIHEYLTCSFPKERSEIVDSHFGQVTLLLASDESDVCYRKGIQQLVEQGLGYGFVDLDDTIQTVLKDYARKQTNGNRLLNNMFIYHISRLLARDDSRIQLVLEQRRHIHCPNCTNVVEQFAQRGSRLQRGSRSTGRLPIKPSLPSLTWDLSQTIDDYNLCIHARSQKLKANN